jgi:hypothetical protein
VRWNLNRFAKCRPFREASELQAGPSSFQHTCTHRYKIVIWYSLEGKNNWEIKAVIC